MKEQKTKWCLHNRAIVSCSALLLCAIGMTSLQTGCAPNQARSNSYLSIGKMPPVDHLVIMKQKDGETRRKITVNRGDIIRIRHLDEQGEIQKLGPFIFFGVEPQEGTLVALRESGDVVVVPISDITKFIWVWETDARRVWGNGGWGALAFGGAGAIGGASIFGIVGAAVGAGFFAVPGLAVGIGTGMALAIDRGHKIKTGRWKILVPTSDTTPGEPATGVEVKLEEPDSSQEVEEPASDAEDDAEIKVLIGGDVSAETGVESDTAYEDGKN